MLKPGERRSIKANNVMIAGEVSLDGMRCEEASIHSNRTYIPCNSPAYGIVWHDRDKRAYVMCEPCCLHNVRNRGGRLLACL
jgi:hypothetical protein